MIRGFLCNWKFKGDKVSFEECLACSLTKDKTCNFNYQLIKAITAGLREEKEDITATSILYCLRKTYLNKIEDYWAPLEELYWAFRGTVFHGELEKQVDENILSENRYYTEIEGIKISGKIDTVLKDLKRLVDFKTTKSLPKFNKPWANHGLQTNIYRWLLKQNGIEVNDIVISYMDMDSVKEIPVEIMSDTEVEEFIKSRIHILKEAYADKKMPPAEKDFICKFCSHVTKCEQLNKLETAKKILIGIDKVAKIKKEEREEVKKLLLQLIKDGEL